MPKQSNDYKKDINEIKLLLEILKKEIETIESKLKKEQTPTKTKEDMRELFDMRNNRG